MFTKKSKKRICYDWFANYQPGCLKPIWDVTGLITPFANKGKPALVFGSYGWSGEGVPMIVERLKGLKLKLSATASEWLCQIKEFEEIKLAVDELMKQVKK